MTKRNEGNGRDPELEKLLAACREIRPEAAELESWKSAVRAEREALARPRLEAPPPRAPVTVLRRFARVAAQIAVAASVGFALGALFMQSRIANDWGALLFSQQEPSASASMRPELDVNREVVRVRIR